MIKNYSDVLLADGRDATIIEVYDDPPGYCVDLGDNVDFVNENDIAEVIRAA